MQLRSTGRLAALVSTVVLFSACPAEDRWVEEPVVDPSVEAPRTDPAVTPPVGAQQATLEAIGGTGVTGDVHATPRDGSVDVMIMLRGALPNESYGARVQSGTCESPGPVLAQLDALRTDNAGQAHSETNVGHAPHLILDGSRVIAVYAPGAAPERDRPIACATFPAGVPLAYTRAVVATTPGEVEVYLVPLSVAEQQPQIMDGLSPASPYYRGRTTAGSIVVEDLERTYLLVIRSGNRVERREVRLRAGRTDTFTIALPGRVR